MQLSPSAPAVPATCPPTACEVVAASTVSELDAAARIRGEVYAEAMALPANLLPAGREISGHDLLDTTTVFVARLRGEVAGTLRMAMRNDGLAARFAGALGLPLEDEARVDDMPRACMPAELGRAAVPRVYRDTEVIGSLYAAAYRAARDVGVTHWLGFSLTETDSSDDVAAIAGLLERRGHVSPFPRLRPRHPVPGPALPRRSLYTTDQRRRIAEGDVDGIDLPHAVAFHLATGCQVIGVPVFDAVFGEFMIPLMLPLDALIATRFGARWCGRG